MNIGKRGEACDDSAYKSGNTKAVGGQWQSRSRVRVGGVFFSEPPVVSLVGSFVHLTFRTK